MIDRTPLYYIIRDGELLQERCHRGDAAAIDHFFHEGEVIARWPSLAGKPSYEYRRLIRCSARAPSGSCFGSPASWSPPLPINELPALLQLLLALSQ